MNYTKIMAFILAASVLRAEVINPDIKPVQKKEPASWYTDASGSLASAITTGDVDLVDQSLKAIELSGEKQSILPYLQTVDNKRTSINRWTTFWGTLAAATSIPAITGRNFNLFEGRPGAFWCLLPVCATAFAYWRHKRNMSAVDAITGKFEKSLVLEVGVDGMLARAITTNDITLLDRSLKALELTGKKLPLLSQLQFARKAIASKRASVKRITALLGAAAASGTCITIVLDTHGGWRPQFVSRYREDYGQAIMSEIVCGEINWSRYAFWHVLPKCAAYFAYKFYTQSMDEIDVFARAVVAKLKASPALEVGADQQAIEHVCAELVAKDKTK